MDWSSLLSSTNQPAAQGAYPTYPNQYGIGSGNVGQAQIMPQPSLGDNSANYVSPSIGGTSMSSPTGQPVANPTSSFNPWSLQGEANAR